MKTILPIKGIFKIRENPFDSEAELLYWWCDERDSSGQVVRPARMSQQEKERYTLLEKENIITSNGISNILTFLGLGSGTATLFNKVLSVGTGLVSTVAASDTTVVTELLRKAPAGTSVTGNQQDVSYTFAAGDANATWTNAGIYGSAATTTLATGTLMTHVLFSYVKTSSLAVTVDYVLIIASV